MKKVYILILVAILGFVDSAPAQLTSKKVVKLRNNKNVLPKVGVRGMLDFAVQSFNVDVVGREAVNTVTVTSLSYTCGQQLTPNWFVGVGVQFGGVSGVEGYNGPDWLCPAYIDCRYNIAINGLSPFGDLRLGYMFGDRGGVYAAPKIGLRLPMGKVTAIAFGLGVDVYGTTRQKFVEHNTSEGVVIQKGGFEKEYISPVSFFCEFDF